jgi:two-component system, LytTR family, sensor kinase
MKKTFYLLILICIASSKLAFAEQPLIQKAGFRPTISDTSYRYWAFLIDRLFDGETKKVLRYDSDIQIRLTGNPKNSDSLIVTSLIKELSSMISTNKVILVRSGGNMVLDFNNGPGIKNLSLRTFNGLGRNFKNEKRPKIMSDMPENIKARLSSYDSLEKNYSSVLFRFNDSLDFSSRKKYIEYEVIQSLCAIRQTENVNSVIKEPILNRPYNNINPLNTEFSSFDKFVLTKLYSVDFQNQIKEYLIKGSSWRSYMIFTHKSVMKSIGILVVIFISILIIFFSYKPVLKRQFKRQYNDYLIKGLLISSSIYILQKVFLWFTVSKVSSDILLNILNLIFFAIAATILISTPLYFIEKLIIRPNSSKKIQSGLKIFLILIIFLILSFIGNHFTLTITQQFTNLISVGIILALGRGVLLFIDYSEQISALTTASEISKLRELSTKAEIQSLQSKINPHFLYNSLNSIAGLAHSNPDKTEKMALALSDFFRYNVSRKDDMFGKIEDELKMVQSYLDIEQIRFGDRLSYKIEVTKGLEKSLIPKFILQPVVENAIKHGIAKIETKGEILISVKEIENNFCLTVADNGPQFPENLVSGNGLQNIYDLLNLVYGDNAKIDWKNHPTKFINILIPKRIE